jgi:myo-inositol 2-dehydrogenase/D-chiro-inositol 1-dehydrogenase
MNLLPQDRLLILKPHMSTFESPSRRQFLRTSSAAVGAVIAAPAIITRSSAAVSPGDTLKVGLVGCGGRGSGAARDALMGDSDAIITAVADVFKNRIDASLANLKADKTVGERVKVEPSNCFVGLDAYQKVIDSGVDVVILATPPGFRPVHLKAAVAAGKHTFCEKPVATDAPGVRSVLESAEQARQKKLAMVSGLCWRYDYPRREFFKRLHQGALGEIRALYHTYLTSPVKPMQPPEARKTGVTDLEWQLRNWYNFVWLSGDGLVEQAVHSVDKMMWAMKDVPPIRCTAVGGRQIPNHEGNIYDHIEVNYEFAGGVRAFMAQRQIPNCHGENRDYIMGEKGNGTIGGRRAPVEMLGEKIYDGPTPDMYQVEHQELFASIRKGEPINDGVRMAHSTLAGIMGRMAAYTGQEVTWDAALESKEKLVPDNLSWDMDLPIAPMAVAGKTRLI